MLIDSGLVTAARGSLTKQLTYKDSSGHEASVIVLTVEEGRALSDYTQALEKHIESLTESLMVVL